jgi:hypothetical protein
MMIPVSLGDIERYQRTEPQATKPMKRVPFRSLFWSFSSKGRTDEKEGEKNEREGETEGGSEERRRERERL